MNVNEEPADIVLGRSVELVTKEEGLGTILFNDHSTRRPGVLAATDAEAIPT